MYEYMKNNNIPVDNTVRKLTQILDTWFNEELKAVPQDFSSYYLWFLIDTCHFVINDILSNTTYNSHDKFQ